MAAAKRILVTALALSALGNGALLLAWRHAAAAARQPQPPAPAPAPAAPSPAPLPADTWAQVQRDDPREFAQQLRAIGVPDRVGRLLVADGLRLRFLARQRELLGGQDAAEFWKTAAAAADADKQAELRRLARVHEDTLAALYGPADDAGLERERRLYGPLPPEKLVRIDRIHADYGDIADDVRARAGGLLLASDREMLALLEQERRKDIAALLTPAELEIYDLQTSPTARTLRARLAGFAPTEQEFHALFALQRAFDLRFGPAVAADESRQRERAAAEAELESGFRRALGPARYAEYRRQQEPGYRIAARIVERFGLPAARAAAVDSLARDTQTRLVHLRDERTLTPEAVRGAVVQIGREAAERVAALLGPEGAELYRQTSAGAWLRALERAVTAATAEEPSRAPVPANPVPETSDGAAPVAAAGAPGR